MAHHLFMVQTPDTPEDGPDFDFYLQQLEKEGYSEKSRKSYLFMMKRFFEYFENKEPRNITMGEIEDYNFEFFVSGRYSRSYQLQFINAIKLYYHLTEGIDLQPEAAQENRDIPEIRLIPRRNSPVSHSSFALLLKGVNMQVTIANCHFHLLFPVAYYGPGRECMLCGFEP